MSGSSAAAPAPPEGFAEFWTARYRRARAVDPAPRIVGTRRFGDRIEHDIAFTSEGHVELGGWLQLPASGEPTRGLVVGHGYGGRSSPELPVPVDDAAVLWFCSRGLPDRGLVPGIPRRPDEHVLHGIQHRDSYVHGGCVADLWCAVTALGLLVPGLARIDYLGTSFGGGIGALAIPWDDRLAAACLVVPSFGNHPLRITVPNTGSGAAVSRYVQQHPETLEVLRWYDAATAAGFAPLPVHVAVAREDAVVPAAGQLSIADALAGSRIGRFVLSYGHRDYPGRGQELAELWEAQRRFLGS